MRAPPSLASWIGPALLAIGLLIAITSCPALSGAGRGAALAPARPRAAAGGTAAHAAPIDREPRASAAPC